MKKQLLFLFAALLPLVASAEKVEIDGIWYNLDESAKQAEVTYKGDYYYSYSNEYSGSITLPATVTYNSVAYSVTSIGMLAFSYCRSLTAITIPEGVTSIGSNAFWYCSSLTDINIPEGVTSIGYEAFRDCSSLTAITIPEGVTSIGIYAFSGCSSLTAISVAEGNTIYDSRGGCNAIIETNSNTLISGCATTIIPESVTSIGYAAFYGCGSLTSITIPKGVTSIGEWAFSGCSSLTAITIPEGVTSIEFGAFLGCDILTAITIPEGVTSIGEEAFYYCSSLTSITIPEGVTSIGESAFYCCGSLTAINIPENSQLTSIREKAFYGCSSLTTITIPESVKSIGDEAFCWCSSLTAITCHAVTPPTIEENSDTFISVDKSIPIYVPVGSVEAYKAATGWSDFTNYVGEETSIEKLEIINHKPTLIYDLHGRRVTNIEKPGIYIVDGRKVVIK